MRRTNKKDDRFYTKLNRLNQRVDWNLLEGKFHKAVKLLRSIVRLCEKRGKKTHQGLTAFRLATVYQNVMSYEEAISYFKVALKCLDAPGAPMTKTVCEIYRGLYACYNAIAEEEEALKYAMLICEFNGLSRMEKAEISQAIAKQLLKMYEQRGNITHVIRGLTYAKDAVHLYEKEEAKGISYVEVLLSCGDLFFHLREYDKALNYLNQAYEHAEALEANRTLISRICFLMSRVYALSGDEERSLFYRHRSLEFA